MIGKHALAAATEVVTALKGRNVTFRGDTPLSMLNETAISATTALRAKVPGAMLSLENIAEDAIIPSLDGIVEHDVVSQELRNSIKAAVINTLSVCRNDLQADTKEGLKHYDDIISIELDKVGELFQVLPVFYHEVWSTYQLESLVERFAERPFEKVRLSGIDFPMMDGVDLRKLMTFGVSSLDEHLDSFFENLGAQRVVDIYTRVFVRGELEVGLPIEDTHTASNGLHRDDYVLIYTIANGILENIPEGITATLESLEEQLGKVKAIAAKVIFNEISRRARIIRRNELVIGVSVKEDTYAKEGRFLFMVNADPYMAYLEAGHTDDAIFGCYLEKKILSYDNIVANAEFYSSRYNTVKTLRVAERNAAIHEAQVNAVIATVFHVLGHKKNEELARPRENIVVDVRNAANEIGNAKGFDPVVAIRDVLAKSIYKHTNAARFVCAMDQAEVENPGLEPRELSLLATMDIIAQFVVAHMKNI